MTWQAVTDEQWERIREQLPRRKRYRQGGRRPVDDRPCLEGILWILWTVRHGASYLQSTARRTPCIAA
jgi:transposase